MTSTARATRPSVAARRFGYGVAVAVNVVFLYLLNVWPGWEVVPFLTPDTRLVLGLVNASIVVNLAVNVVYLLRDDPWLKSLGDIVTLVVGLMALIRIWRVFPFDFGDATFDWALVCRVLLGVAIVGSVIGLVVALVGFGRNVRGAGTARPAPR